MIVVKSRSVRWSGHKVFMENFELNRTMHFIHVSYILLIYCCNHLPFRHLSDIK